MDKSLEKEIKDQIKDNKVIIYMKGTPNDPRCGFSQTASFILNKLVKSFAYVDILERQDIRETLKKISNWPTFPQVYINGELIGGSDIIYDMYKSGELAELVNNLD